MKPIKFLLVANALLLACSFASLAAPTPTPEPTAAPTATATATRTPTPIATPTVNVAGLVIVPETYELVGGIPPEYGLLRFGSAVGVEKDTRLYLKVELESGLYFAVFGGPGDMWDLLELIPLEPTPAPNPGREAEMLGQ